MSKGRVVVTDYEYSHLDWEQEELDRFDYTLEPHQCKTEEEIIAIAKDADGMLVQYAQITPHIINNLSRVRAISRYGIGVDVIDLEAASRKGIYVINVPDYCEEDVSDHALGFLIACNRRILQHDRLVKKGIWDYKENTPVYRFKGRQLGLIAFGKIAQLLAQKAQALGLKVVAYDPYIDEELARKYNVELMDFDTIIRTSHYISLHAPLTRKTEHMFNAEAFSKMKREAFLINTARGGLIDEEALIEALKKKEIAGAGLDVLQEEPIRDNHPLKEMDQVIITPHAAWNSILSQEELQRKAARYLGQVLSGETDIESIVNKHML